MNIQQYWKDVLAQNADAIRSWFSPNAWINWHNTNERFNVEDFIRANCEYPGSWTGEIEQLIYAEDRIITATHVHTQDSALHFHVTSFIHFRDEKILSIDEYWGEDGNAPQWRKDLHIDCQIK